jgi:hypothetical protein
MTVKNLKELYCIVLSKLSQMENEFYICTIAKYDCDFNEIEIDLFLKHFTSKKPIHGSKWVKHWNWLGWSAWWKPNEKEQRVLFLNSIIQELK